MAKETKDVTILDLQFIADSRAINHSHGICRRLGVSEAVLSQADESYPLGTDGAPSKRFMYALKYWFDGNGHDDGKPVPVALDVLGKALKESRCKGVFEEMKKKHGKKYVLCNFSSEIQSGKHNFQITYRANLIILD